MDLLTDFITQLNHWPLAVILILGLNGLGYAIKQTKYVANGFIPFILLTVACVLWALIGDVSVLNPKQTYPHVVLALYGSVLGFAAWGFHKVVLQYVEKFLPGYKAGDDDADESSAPKTNNPPTSKS